MKVKSMVIFGLLVVSCSNTNGTESKPANGKLQLTKENRMQVVKEVRKTLDNYFDAVRKNGLKGEFAFLDNSSDFYWIPPGYNEPVSYDSVAAILNSRAAAYAEVSNFFSKLKISPVSNDTAFYAGYVVSAITDTAGIHSKYKLYEEGVLIRRKNGWKLLHGKTVLNQVMGERHGDMRDSL